MYYYILDLGNKNISRVKEKLETLMASYGISGDFGKISPLCSAYELAKRAKSEGYTTIVAIGGSEIINQVMQALVNSDIAMGIIPIGANQSISDLVGVTSLKEALEILRVRKIETIDIGKISESKYFLTEAKIINHSHVATVLDFDDFRIGGNFKEIIIANGGESKESFKDGVFDIKVDQIGSKRSVWSIFQKSDQISSIFHQESVKIESEKQSEILVDNEVVAQTPCTLDILPLAIKLIVARLH